MLHRNGMAQEVGQSSDFLMIASRDLTLPVERISKADQGSRFGTSGQRFFSRAFLRKRQGGIGPWLAIRPEAGCRSNLQPGIRGAESVSVVNCCRVATSETCTVC